jgi:lipopolysaccharide heptosyltransferase II
MSATWDDARRVLCVRLDNMGDVLMTTPAMRALKESLPGRSLTLLASRAGARLAHHLPEIDAAIGYDAPWMKHDGPALPSEDLTLVASLVGMRFEAAVIFTVFTQSALPAALLCQLSGIPLRLAHCRENPYRLLTDWVPETDTHERARHEVRRQLDLVATVDATVADERLSFRVSAEERLHAMLKLVDAGIDPERDVVVVHPGATASSRRYDPKRFGAAAGEIADLFGCQVAVTGSASERDLAEFVRVSSGPEAFSLAGALTLGEFGAVIERSPLLVSNNTGAVHIAAAMGTPVVDLYALTNPQHTPWLVPNRVLSRDVPCRNCYKSVCPEAHHRCLDGIGVDEIVAAARELWNPCERRQAA